METQKKYEKPWIIKEERMNFPMRILEAKTEGIVYK